MIIERATSLPPGTFASYVQRHRLIFHGERWTANYGPGLHQFAILNRNREIVGCFLYFVFRKMGFKCIISPPFTPDIALHFDNPAASTVGRNTFVKEVLAAVAGHLSSERAHYVSVNFPPGITDGQPLIWSSFLARNRYTYLLDLRRGEEDLWKNLSSEKRKSIGKASRDGVLVRPPRSAGEVLRLVERSLTRSGKTGNLVTARKLTEAFATADEGICFVAEHNDAVIAAGLCVTDGDRAIYLFGGYDESGGHHGAHVSCMWQSILEAKKRGCSIFDFEGSMDKNIERYFREFGPELTPYLCAEKIRPLMKALLWVKGHNPL